MNAPLQQFGGDWTEQKLDMVEKYLGAYTQALKRQPFELWYIDAFAGTGYRELKEDESSDQLLFPELAEDAPQGFLDGSARKALQIKLPFHGYLFLEKNSQKCKRLESLKDEFPALNIRIHNVEANQAIREICSKSNWKRTRAVLFLDPFGMQVEWSTLKAIADTKAIDLWLLFPLSLGAIRLLKHDGQINQSWRRRLDLFFGDNEWVNEFFRTEQVQTLFGDTENQIFREVDVQKMQAYFQRKLEGVFAGVAATPKVLTNSKNLPLFSLYFAAGNPRGAGLAIKIAGHILSKG